MPARIPAPDPQKVHLDAVSMAVIRAAEACDRAGIDPDAVADCFADEPYQSVVFMGDDLADEDPETRADIVNIVGSYDLSRQIAEAEAELSRLNDLLDPDNEDL